MNQSRRSCAAVCVPGKGKCPPGSPRALPEEQRFNRSCRSPLRPFSLLFTPSSTGLPHGCHAGLLLGSPGWKTCQEMTVYKHCTHHRHRGKQPAVSIQSEGPRLASAIDFMLYVPFINIQEHIGGLDCVQQSLSTLITDHRISEGTKGKKHLWRGPEHRPLLADLSRPPLPGKALGILLSGGFNTSRPETRSSRGPSGPAGGPAVPSGATSCPWKHHGPGHSESFPKLQIHQCPLQLLFSLPLNSGRWA